MQQERQKQKEGESERSERSGGKAGVKWGLCERLRVGRQVDRRLMSFRSCKESRERSADQLSPDGESVTRLGKTVLFFVPSFSSMRMTSAPECQSERRKNNCLFLDSFLSHHSV